MNEKQINFCNEYLLDFNATKAAIRAGYSAKSAYSQVHDLLKKPEIVSMLEAASKEKFKLIGLNTERIVAEIASIAFGEDSLPKDKIKALETLLKYELLKADKAPVVQADKCLKIEFVDTPQLEAEERRERIRKGVQNLMILDKDSDSPIFDGEFIENLKNS